MTTTQRQAVRRAGERYRRPLVWCFLAAPPTRRAIVVGIISPSIAPTRPRGRPAAQPIQNHTICAKAAPNLHQCTVNRDRPPRFHETSHRSAPAPHFIVNNDVALPIVPETHSLKTFCWICLLQHIIRRDVMRIRTISSVGQAFAGRIVLAPLRQTNPISAGALQNH